MAMSNIDLTGTVQASLKGGEAVTTDIERELCQICADRDRLVIVPGRRSKVKCGGKNNPRCPGFTPGNVPDMRGRT